MGTSHYEQMEFEDRRRADRLMVFAALRARRATAGRRRLLTALLWALGLR